jgi:hypothetical protein
LQPVLLIDQWFRESQSAIPTYLRSRAAIEAELRTLEAELALRTADAVTIDTLAAENALLREQLAYATTSLQTARILHQPPLIPYDRLIINRGTGDGVVLDAPVFAGEFVLIGRVVQVGVRQSVVELLSSPGVESTVYIFGPDIYTTAVGQGGGVVRVGVPQGVELGIGNPVSVPVAGRGLIGSISHIETAATRPEQYGFVPLPVSLTSLQYVQVGSQPLVPVDFEAARSAVAQTRDTYFTVPVPAGVLIDIPTSGDATSTATSTPSETATTTTEAL